MHTAIDQADGGSYKKPPFENICCLSTRPHLLAHSFDSQIGSLLNDGQVGLQGRLGEPSRKQLSVSTMGVDLGTVCQSAVVTVKGDDSGRIRKADVRPWC